MTAGVNTGAGYAVITYKVADAPLVPTLTGPAPGAVVNTKDSGITFLFAYNPGTDSGTINAVALRLKQGTDAYGYWNGTDFSSSDPVWNTVDAGTASVDIPADVIDASATPYNWSIACQESNANLQGNFASDSSFTSEAKPTAVLTAPAGTADPSTLEAEWTTTPSSGASQTDYRVVIYTEDQTEAGGFIPGSATGAAYDSGTISGDDDSLDLSGIATTNLPNAGPWVLYLQVTETGDLLSDWASTTFEVLYPPPAVPTLQAVPDTDSTTSMPITAITVWQQDDPDDDPQGYVGNAEAQVQFSDDDGTTWTDLRNGTATVGTGEQVTVYDYEAPFNTARQYQARIVGTAADQSYSDWSDATSCTVTSDQWWIVIPTDTDYALAITRSGLTPLTTNGIFELDEDEEQGVFWPPGSQTAIIVRGAVHQEEFDLDVMFTSDDDYATFTTIRRQQKTVLIRTHRGDIWYRALGAARPAQEANTPAVQTGNNLRNIVIHCTPVRVP